MKFVVIIALSLASLSLAAPSIQPRLVGDVVVSSGTSCSSPRPIDYGLDHLIGDLANSVAGDVVDDVEGITLDLVDGIN